MNVRLVACILPAAVVLASPALALAPATPTTPAATATARPAATKPAALKTAALYQRLGGFDKLAAFFDDVAPHIFAHPQLAHFFTGHSTDSNMRQRQRLIELLCAETGGPCYYTGRSMKLTHAGMGIAESDWNAFNTLLSESLDRINVKAPEKGELLAIIGRYKPEIVEKP
jgi:hemoglobin